MSLDSLKLHNITTKLTDRDGGRSAAPMFSEVKLHILSKESGGFEEGIENTSFPCLKACHISGSTPETCLRLQTGDMLTAIYCSWYTDYG